MSILGASVIFWSPSLFGDEFHELSPSYNWKTPYKKSVASNAVPVWLTLITVSLSVRTYDDDIREQHRDFQQMSKETEHIGDILGTGIPGLAIVSLQYYFDPNEAAPHFAALSYTAGATYLFKTLSGRERPGGNRSHQSFPSGHTSTAFATATALSLSYGWKAAAVAYPLATFTGLSRLASDSHFASDVVAGALLGMSFAFWSSRQSQIEAMRPSSGLKLSSLTYDPDLEQIFLQWQF